MSFTVTLTYTKPDDVKWFGEVNPASAATLNKFVQEYDQDELLSVESWSPDKNTNTITYVFCDADGNNIFKALIENLPETIERRKYCEDNNITFTVTCSGGILLEI
jgi:hypothetical protein